MTIAFDIQSFKSICINAFCQHFQSIYVLHNHFRMRHAFPSQQTTNDQPKQRQQQQKKRDWFSEKSPLKLLSSEWYKTKPDFPFARLSKGCFCRWFLISLKMLTTPAYTHKRQRYFNGLALHGCFVNLSKRFANTTELNSNRLSSSRFH